MNKKLEKTKKGHPALWECGGGYSNTGYSQIVANADGSPKKPIYIRRRGSLANDDHALFIVGVGDVIIEADHHRGDFNITVSQITHIEDDEAQLEQLHRFSMGEWDIEPPDKFTNAIQAAENKACCYHCRRPHFIFEN